MTLRTMAVAEQGGVRRVTDAARRTFDIAAAAIGLVCLLPLVLLICATILLEDGPPVFFWQKRFGRNGRIFRLYKFRKFAANAANNGLPLTLRNGPRLTGVGWFLEKTKLDELPQLWNVVRGEMSLVGPRPESMTFADCFNGPHRRLLEYRPGLLGPAQTAFSNEGSLYPPARDPEQFYREFLFPAKASLDLAYYPSRTLPRDLGWIIRGVLAVVLARPLRPSPQPLLVVQGSALPR
jgi:lipopolysaccharide/colanic/teichoic acid biosynthesis glycosyltransferase